MKSLFRAALVVGLLGGLGLGPILTEPAAAATSKRASAPTKKEALRFMLQHGDVPLDASSCASVKDPEDRTLADYLSRVLTVQTDPTIRWYIGVTPKSLRGTGDRWQIDVKFYGSDAGDRYDMGIRFVMDRVTRRITPSTVMCTGTS